MGGRNTLKVSDDFTIDSVNRKQVDNLMSIIRNLEEKIIKITDKDVNIKERQNSFREMGVIDILFNIA